MLASCVLRQRVRHPPNASHTTTHPPRRRQPHPVVRRRSRLPRATLRVLEPVFTTLPNMWTKLTQSAADCVEFLQYFTQFVKLFCK
ncbi:hypothetical protein BLNAU_11828 [Blattamonas nauphoetae]|uniref:Uncharacterized protein n=1 Tax=Blattamonas nauphoetae TaxID=2049346 RepID=A0ABQ9WNK4_9EUKA|nr:hypothetical protein BLNAU_25203 [Blattamonas nauphoetae]KAK2940933.1 hypothetical protein BLNAU_24152 [Blattamonas nauphoetae]KAK2945485.1 hypothetical protein BLNAU_19558 [Blattamonas nauphoetae]KAK2946859.1 hypothetical protein BLNAU_18238 [Blattamonas nauphoetae]KAK2952687.1 hypothetical protein BLNAU_12336 [Blattamonas nauphoetae]